MLDNLVNFHVIAHPKKKGTIIRSYAIDTHVSQSLSMSGPKKQVVTLGAGFDTRHFNIKVRDHVKKI
ncbi:MAG: class I SAM-dependent methyltransferase [Paenibacillus sp.]|nr:class I SAM-dependent methyltransferase [Paenibacillus sp.]